MNLTSDHVQSEVEYYLGLYPEEKQSFQGLIAHLATAINLGEIKNSLIGDVYDNIQKSGSHRCFCK